VVYATTGSEATFYAMRIARAYTGRSKIVKCEGAYHGNHDYSSFSVSPKTLSEYPVGQPDTGGIPTGIREQILIAPYNDLDTVARIFKEHQDDIAALIVEPVQRNIPPQPGFLEGLRELCTEHGIVLIFDEVVTGFRLAYGGAQEFFGVTPDLATYGKIVGGGGPGSCVAGRREIMGQSDPVIRGQDAYAYVNGTLHGNPIGCVAGMATLQELRTPGFYDRLHARTETFKTNVQAIIDAHGLEARTWGTGSLWQTVFMDRIPTRHADMMKANMALTKELDRQLLLRGIYVLPGVRRFVSSVHTDEDFAQTYEAFDAACKTVKAAL
jgi:glutamate-1-semialdehyde 2,1-aminomutase